jgi:hypothetical protein
MLVLIEGAVQGETLAIAQAAKALRYPVVEVPATQPLPIDGGSFQWGFVFGGVPSVARYQSLHEQAKEKNIALLNDVTQHAHARESEALAPLRSLDGHSLRRVENKPRSYRLFVLDADVLAMGFLGAPADLFGPLSDREQSDLLALAREAAVRTRVPWLAVDAAQLENGEWRVTGTHEPSNCGLGTIDPAHFVASLARALDMRGGC